MSDDIAGRIASLRARLGITQQELGRRAGVSKQAVNQWERGVTTPERDALLRLMRSSGVNPDWIMQGVGPMFFAMEAAGVSSRQKLEAALETLRPRVAAIEDAILRKVALDLIAAYLTAPSMKAGEPYLDHLARVLPE